MVEDHELPPEGEDFELECGPAPERCSQGMKERKDDRAHVRHATTNSGKTSMISRRMEFLHGQVDVLRFHHRASL